MIKTMIKKEIIVCFCMFFMLTNCYLIPCNLDSGLDEFKANQKDEFFVGEYMVEKFINNGYNIDTGNLSLKINEDKTIEIKNIPKYILNLIESEEKINISGKWETNYLEESKKENYFLVVSFKYNKSRKAWKLYKKNNKPVILIEVGDPDECSAIRFIKK
ncbi:hypothetical protein Q4553_07505 [Tenacibaculum soleae]|uniref:hypothetical protein n=2 Tax=Tenacibaculum soleae TaxID=447689 RepID=UPI0026E28485|nr:hypothetical protein [Tenacibaculum soleae]MDO6744414.1 hypothetical protein [Tenacibaculum soleae]